MEFYLSVFMFALAATITPGPNNVMIMASGLNHGVMKSLPHWFGICLGFPMMAVLVGLGFGVVFEMFPLLHLVIKVLGLSYLSYLAWVIATIKRDSLKTEKKRPLKFWQAILFQWVNPKAWVMITSAMAAFTNLDSGTFLQVLVIAAIFMLVSFPCVGLWMVFGVGIQRILRRDSHQRMFNITMALLLIMSMFPVLRELVEIVI